MGSTNYEHKHTVVALKSIVIACLPTAHSAGLKATTRVI